MRRYPGAKSMSLGSRRTSTKDFQDIMPQRRNCYNPRLPSRNPEIYLQIPSMLDVKIGNSFHPIGTSVIENPCLPGIG
jgi:hypothetical protein